MLADDDLTNDVQEGGTHGRGQASHDDFRVVMHRQSDRVGEAPGWVGVSDVANCPTVSFDHRA
jgi:hypothetical protein